MRLQNTNGLIQWNLPAAFAAISAFFLSWFPSGTAVESPAPVDSSNREVSSTAPFVPTLGDIVSYPTGIWEDPFKHRSLALEQFEKPKTGTDTPESYQSVLKRFKEASEQPLLVMPVIVLGKQSGTDATDRIQYRHAVENALSLQGFSMDFEDRMSYIRIEDYKVIKKVENNRHEIPVEAILPIKLYANGGDSILVMWIDNRLLGNRPLFAIERLIEKTLEWSEDEEKQEFNKIDVAIIGPSYSGELEEFYEESEVGDDTYDGWLKNGRTTIYSPSATATKTTEYSFTDIKFVRTIGDNAALIGRLADELKCRWLLGKKTVLFVENGVSSPDDLLEQFVKSANGNNKDETIAEDNPGKQVEEQTEAESTTEIDDECYRPDTDNNKISVIPFLTGLSKNHGGISDVRDYFARQIQDVDSGATITRVPNEDTALVGIFANETEDKLEIIKAARRLYPAATFFTIDMDARFTELENLAFTRNLLVASHFGLSLQIP
ncbi:MAG: hypothetical protein KDB27_15260, partial [Planctomycetales bacterium]|nr:hypothetical protein [Planctomycetales bacterium]